MSFSIKRKKEGGREGRWEEAGAAVALDKICFSACQSILAASSSSHSQGKKGKREKRA